MERNVGGNDQWLSTAIPAINHVVDLFQSVLGATFHAKIINNQQHGAAKLGNVVVAALEAGGQIVQYQCKVRHADGDFHFHQRICDTSRKVALSGADATPQKIADVLRLHSVPMLHIEMGVLHLRAFDVVIGKGPLQRSRVGEAPAFQIRHGLTVTR